MGKAGAFSFTPGNNVGPCGEAGAVRTNDGEVANTIRILRDHGKSKRISMRWKDLMGDWMRYRRVSCGLSPSICLRGMRAAARMPIAITKLLAHSMHSQYLTSLRGPSLFIVSISYAPERGMNFRSMFQEAGLPAHSTTLYRSTLTRPRII